MLSVSIPNEVTSVDCLCGPGPVSDMDRSLVIGIQVRSHLSRSLSSTYFVNSTRVPAQCYSEVSFPLHLSAVKFLRDRFAG